MYAIMVFWLHMARGQLLYNDAPHFETESECLAAAPQHLAEQMKSPNFSRFECVKVNLG
jgi:hypothetical protein